MYSWHFPRRTLLGAQISNIIVFEHPFSVCVKKNGQHHSGGFCYITYIRRWYWLEPKVPKLAQKNYVCEIYAPWSVTLTKYCFSTPNYGFCWNSRSLERKCGKQGFWTPFISYFQKERSMERNFEDVLLLRRIYDVWAKECSIERNFYERLFWYTTFHFFQKNAPWSVIPKKYHFWSTILDRWVWCSDADTEMDLYHHPVS